MVCLWLNQLCQFCKWRYLTHCWLCRPTRVDDAISSHSPSAGRCKARRGDSTTTLDVAAVHVAADSAGVAGSGLRNAILAANNREHELEDGAGQGGSGQSEQVLGSERSKCGKSHRRLGSWAGPVLQVQAMPLIDSEAESAESGRSRALQVAAREQIRVPRLPTSRIDTSGPI